MDPYFRRRRAAAYQAYFEHMPLRNSMVPLGHQMRLYEQVAFGNLIRFYMVDDRQYRSHQPCASPGRGGSTVVEECADRLDPKLTLLGEVQERWLETSLRRLRASEAETTERERRADQ